MKQNTQKTLVLATTNPAKFDRYAVFLERYKRINLVKLSDLGIYDAVDEPYDNAVENARHKAIEYAKLTSTNVFSIDECMEYNFLGENQLGAHVRAAIGRDHEASDQEVHMFFDKEIKEFSGVPYGKITSALCICTDDGRIIEEVIDEKFILLKDNKVPYLQGYPLSGRVLVGGGGGKVFAELTKDEKITLFPKREAVVNEMVSAFLR